MILADNAQVPDPGQLDIFGNQPVLKVPAFQPEEECPPDEFHDFHIRSPTLNGEQQKRADSLHRKSRELVQKSKCLNQNAEP